MALILNILLFCMAAGFFAGRLYELINLIDPQTGYLIVDGIIFNAYTIPIFLIISVCCGILMLGDVKNVNTFFAKSAGIFSVFAGVSFIGYVVVNVISNSNAQIEQTSKFILFIIVGAVGLLLLGIIGLKGKNYEALTVILLLAFSVGLCLDAIIFNVSSIYNIEFLKNSLSTISISFFFLMVFKNVYSPSASAKMWLYISGIICFVLCGVMHLVDIVYGFIQSNIATDKLLLLVGYVFLGIYAVVTSFFAIPNGKIETKIKDCEPAVFDSIKMLANTQEIKIDKKAIDVSDIALHERENQFAKKYGNAKTSVYAINAIDQPEILSKKEKKKAEKLNKKNQVKNQTVESDDKIKTETVKTENVLEKQEVPKETMQEFFKATKQDTIKEVKQENNGKREKVKIKKEKHTKKEGKIVYKRPQD